MGIHDRDYYRESAGGMFDAWGRQGVTFWLIVVNCLVLLAQVVTQDMAGGRGEAADVSVTEWGRYDYRAILDGQVWRLVTPMFLHGGLWHLAFNMLVLYWAGSRLEEHYGGREFLLFYLAGGVFANAAYFLVHVLTQPPAAYALGASGAVTAVLVLFAFHHPHERIMVMFVIPMPVWMVVVIYVALDAVGFLGGRAGIGYAAHLGGALFGALYYQWGGRFSNLLPGPASPTRRRAAPRLRVVPRDTDGTDEGAEPVRAAVDAPPRVAEAGDEPLEAKVDRVLDKVSRTGQESLTPEERELLFRAGEVYKKRRK